MLRSADASDASAISATLREAFAEFEALYTPAAFRATTPTTDQIRTRMAEGPVWVAERDGKVTAILVTAPAHILVILMRVCSIAGANPMDVRALLVNAMAEIRERGSQLTICSAAHLNYDSGINPLNGRLGSESLTL